MDTNQITADALERFGLSGYQVTYIRHNENLTYKIHKINDEYLLRIHEPITPNLRGVQHTFEGLNSEAHYMKALEQFLGIGLQKPIPSSEDDYPVTLYDRNTGISYLATLLTWIPGEPMTASMDHLGSLVTQIGELLQSIHQFSRSWTPPQPFTRPIYDEAKFKSQLSMVRSGVDLQLFTRDDYAIVEQSVSRILSIIGEVHKTNDHWGLIHGDLGKYNIIVSSNNAIPIDFSFSGYGYFLFDVGVSLANLKAELYPYLIEGYEKNYRALNAEEMLIIDASLLLCIVGWLGQSVSNPAQHDTLRKKLPSLCREYFFPFLNDKTLISKI